MAQKFVVQPSSHGNRGRNGEQRFKIYLDASDYHIRQRIRPKEDLTLRRTEVHHRSQEVIFDDHFQSSVNVTDSLFATRARARQLTVTATCEFAELKESLIRDRFVCGLSNAVVKERLLRTSSLQLHTALDTCRATKLAKEQVKAIESPPEKGIAPSCHDATAVRAVIKANTNQCPSHRDHHLVSVPVVVTSMGLNVARRMANSAIFARELAILRHVHDETESQRATLHSAPGVPMPEERDGISGVEKPSVD